MWFPSTVGSLNLYMRRQSPTSARRAPPVLILHGATFPSGNAAGWKIAGRSWMDELASEGYEVYALDFLGYGKSDRYPEMADDDPLGSALGGVDSMVQQVDSAVSAILERQGGDRVNLVAHSAGTFVAARYAQIHPDRVARLVLFGPPAPDGGPQPATPSPGRLPQVRYVDVSRADQLDAFEIKVRESHHLDRAMFDTWAEAYLETDAHSHERRPASVRVPAGLSSALQAVDQYGELPYDPGLLMTPTLVIVGEWDAVAPPAGAEWICRQLGSPLKTLVVVDQAGHRAHLERNRWQLYRETAAFLNGAKRERNTPD